MSLPAYRFNFSRVPPIQQIGQGDIVEIEIPDSDGLGAGMTMLPRDQFDWETGSSFPGNPVYGPIAVNGAEPGDALEIHILGVTPTRSIARTLLAPNHGYLPDELMRGFGPDSSDEVIPTQIYLWEITGDKASLSNPLGPTPPPIGIRPFIGCIATVRSETDELSSLLSASHGGNLDLPVVGPGCTLWLPVSVAGGLLYAGDIHAAQGDGELVGGGLEVSGRASLRCHVRKNDPLRWPRYQKEDGRGCICTQPTLAGAVRLASAEMIDWLAHEGLNRYDAYAMISQSCQIRLGNITETSCTVACHFPESKI